MTDRARTPAFRLLTVGHSNHNLEQFLDLLRGAGVTALADVRSSPFSRRLPHFNGPQLAAALRPLGIAYVFLGDELGGRPRPRDLYDDEGRVDYEKVRDTDFFRAGLERLARGAEQYVVAMMCGEEDPLDCHRGLMIAPALVQRGLRPGHVRRDGTVETTEDMERRLLDTTAVAGGLLDGLFAAHLDETDRGWYLAEAYRRMARRKAFQLPAEEEEEY